MNVGFQNIRVHFNRQRIALLAVFFILELRAPRRRHKHIDFLEQRLIQESHIVSQCLVIKHLDWLSQRSLWHSKHLAQEAVIIGQILHPIPIRIERQTSHSKNQDFPQIHPGAPGGGFAS